MREFNAGFPRPEFQRDSGFYRRMVDSWTRGHDFTGVLFESIRINPPCVGDLQGIEECEATQFAEFIECRAVKGSLRVTVPNRFRQEMFGRPGQYGFPDAAAIALSGGYREHEFD